ncbi:hypothetical protein BS78_06G242300 [Paspalum vaginatum]|nr:hypothetical protein BS78_06G242300 [Paspalum vaginatum]
MPVFVRNRTSDECTTECCSNCSCTAYAYANMSTALSGGDLSRCLLWFGELVDMGKYLHMDGEDLYLRQAGSRHQSGCFRCLASDHLVKDCRDPVRCRRCGAFGHMERRCKSSQWPPRRATPWPRAPTVPVPAGRMPVRPVPFSASDSPLATPPRSAAPPPSPFVPVAHVSPAFDPPNLIPSSSNQPPDFQIPAGTPAPVHAPNFTPPPLPFPELPPQGQLPRRSHPSPRLPSLLEVHTTTSPRRGGVRPPSPPCAADEARGSRSPPSRASPAHTTAGHAGGLSHAASDDEEAGPGESPRRATQAQGPAPQHGIVDADDHTSPEASDEEVDSDGSPFRAAPAREPENFDDDPLWMPPGDFEFGSRVAYAYLNEDAPTLNPSPFIRAAIYSVANAVHYTMHPSSRGAMMLIFDNRELRDAVVDMQPIIHDGGRLSLERSEETSNRFLAIPEWLVALEATDFPAEHWNPVGIPAGFRKLGTVVEIDPENIHPNPRHSDYTSLRVVIERVRPTGIPEDHWIANHRGLGTTFGVRVLRVWRREEQLDNLGRLRPFFPRAPDMEDGDYFELNGGPNPQAASHLRRNAGRFGLNLPHPFGGARLATLLASVITGYPQPLSLTLPALHLPILVERSLLIPIPAMDTHPDRAQAMLALPWHGDDVDANVPPSPPPPSPVSTAYAAAEEPVRRGRRPRRRAPTATATRNSSRLAAKEPEEFVDMTSRAVHLKALRENLQACSKPLQKHVKTCKLTKRKNPLGALDLGRLAKAAGLGCADRRAVAVAATAPTSP